MPKQVLKVTNFKGGVNSVSDARDIEDNQFAQNWNAITDKDGVIRVSGGIVSTDYLGYYINTSIDFSNTKQSYTNMDISKYKDKHLKVIVEEKTDTNQFGEFIDRLHNEINTHEVNVIEDSYNINATADVNIIDQGEDTLTFLHNYINSLDTELDKARINSIMKDFYQEVQEK